MNDMIPLFKVHMSPDVGKAVSDVLLSGYVGQGEKVEEFEKMLGSYVGNSNLITTNSATSADHLALRLLSAPQDGNWAHLSPGDEVLTSALTCTATNWPILANNFKIKWVDVDPTTCNIDLEDLKRKLSPTTKAIMVVHWGGYPNDLDKLKEIQDYCLDKYGFKPYIIEDCAHSFGATYKGKKLGNHGNLCFFSFQAIKHFTTVDGGALFVPNEEFYKRSKLLRWYGIDRESNRKDFRCKEDIPEWGYKFHMNDVNATIGIENFKFADKVVQAHRDNTSYYNESLKDTPGVTLMEDSDDRVSSCWIHTIKVENQQGFMDHMKDCNIMVSRVHERNDKHSCVSEFKDDLPNLDSLCTQMICIPNGWWVTKEQREYISNCIRKGW